MTPGDTPSVRAEIERLRGSGNLTAAEASRLAEQAARACIVAPRALDEGVSLLCELATHPDPPVAAAGVEGIFRQVVEPLADAFDPRLCDLYIEFFARVIHYCRGLHEAAGIHRRLRRMGISSEQDLILRARSLGRVRATPAPAAIRKVLVLSRVTLGADVAITSVVLRRLLRDFPQTPVLLLGSRKTGLLFAGEPRIHLREAAYPRGGTLLDRLLAWLAVAERVGQETAGLRPNEYLVVDPDSRLTQLGMLPVTPDESAYYFFPSRCFARPGVETLAGLTAAWLDEVFGQAAEPVHPWLRVEPAARLPGRWAAVNLGVGENPRKRIDDPFEPELLRELLRSGWSLYLDYGDGDEEHARIGKLLDGLNTDRIVPCRGTVDEFASRIAASDVYIGYDSAFQHIAAALGVPVVDVFAGFSSPQMVRRWRPSGPAQVSQIVVDPDRPADPAAVLASVLEALP